MTMYAYAKLVQAGLPPPPSPLLGALAVETVSAPPWGEEI
jgi:hypothetical protein